MKKILMTLAAVLCCTMTTTVFTACGSDDDNTNTNTPPAQPKVVSYQIDYSLEFPESFTLGSVVCGNLYLLCDKLEVGYTDENGQEQREVINNGKWSKSVTYKYKKNLATTLKVYVTKPASIDASSLTYDQYADQIVFMPTDVAGITTFYDNGKNEQSPRSTFSYTPKQKPNAYLKNKVPGIFDIVIKPETEVLHIEFLN